MAKVRLKTTAASNIDLGSLIVDMAANEVYIVSRHDITYNLISLNNGNRYLTDRNNIVDLINAIADYPELQPLPQGTIIELTQNENPNL